MGSETVGTADRGHTPLLADRRQGGCHKQFIGAFFRIGNDSGSMIHVIAIVTTQPGQRDTVLQIFQANVPAVKAEQGCIEYEATVDSEPKLKFQAEFGSDTFVVVEKWESLAALEAHSV